MIFVDEFSFLSQAHLSSISLRCQQATNDWTRPFGKFHVVIVGDPRQHDPPLASPLVKGARMEAQRRVLAPASRPAVCTTDPSQRGPARPDPSDLATQTGQLGTAARRVAPDREVADANGRRAFTSFERVINLTQQQRAATSPSGAVLGRYVELFNGDCEPSDDQVAEFCDAFQSKAVTEAGVPMPLLDNPRVVTQRQQVGGASAHGHGCVRTTRLSESPVPPRSHTCHPPPVQARKEINFALSLSCAAAQGKRAVVWLSQHYEANGACMAEDLQRHVRKRASPNDFSNLPSALVFWEVRV